MSPAGTVTVVVPSIPTRDRALLVRALRSVAVQTRLPDAVHVEFDHRGDGPGATRNRALAAVRTDVVAFLDDDDELLPQHLSRCMRTMRRTGADLVYPNYWMDGQSDRLGTLGKPFDAARLRERNFIPVTVLAKVNVIREVGGFPVGDDAPLIGEQRCEDWGLRMLDAGAVFAPLHEVTWLYHRHNGNLSGQTARPSRVQKRRKSRPQ